MQRLWSYCGLIIGLAILIWLITSQDVDAIIKLFRISGSSLLLLPLVSLGSLFLATVSWRLLYPGTAPRFSRLLTALWVGRAVNTLLPVATIGGEIAKARLLIFWYGNGRVASATVIVDKTIQAIALIPWALVGATLFLSLGFDRILAFYIFFAIILLGLGIIGFVILQRQGLISRLADALMQFELAERKYNLSDYANEVESLINGLYTQKSRVLTATLWRSLSLVIQTLELWLACYLLGYPISLIEAIVLRSLTHTLNDLAFFIPNAYGIQESGFVFFGGLMLGLDPKLAIAISLATRIKDVFIDLPAVLYWHRLETKNFLKDLS